MRFVDELTELIEAFGVLTIGGIGGCGVARPPAADVTDASECCDADWGSMPGSGSPVAFNPPLIPFIVPGGGVGVLCGKAVDAP